MSAGTGIQHSEMNNHPNDQINLFQIWIVPNKSGVTPRYEQQKFDVSKRKNKLQILVSLIDNKIEGLLKIHQDAQISRIDLEKNSNFSYTLKSENHGVYMMIIKGDLIIENELFSQRDAIGISETKNVDIKAESDSELLLIEVPMQF
jgi:redox-sensitive bicupin YhaK (pirin superfamily)